VPACEKGRGKGIILFGVEVEVVDGMQAMEHFSRPVPVAGVEF
jgi:hypothetical protein